ncbi:hypothetical protein E2C01_100888 [Portunus trituberculatus]|uniref:Uncharacterized protein n=1 Tax=Portunus trituberculatus TaxID=210409 RepID=A0A5B7KEQ8_PORTR|nr:hypothetical protein [Portunus trituberculatus]
MWLKAADPAKKPISFFSLIKDTRAEECSWTRATLVQCLGQVAALTPSEADQNWVEGPIMLHLLNIINSNKVNIITNTADTCSLEYD